jgi:glyoxylase-like metal-dependent hydrolase (beta-lactamase superfamily II)
VYIEKNLVVGPFQCNCRLIVCPRTGHGLLIDPGDEAEQILKAVSTARTPGGAPVEIKYLLHTHGHLDHVGAARPVREKLATAPKIALHRGDEPLYLALQTQGQLFGLTYEQPLPVDHYLEEGEELKVGDLKLSIIHTPGHSPGSICLRLHEDGALKIPETLYSGDTLFQGSVGRTDLWGGDQDQMFKSIRSRILSLDDDTRVCPGHGPETRIGIEKRENPFLT